jgi:hypothetical protein
MILVVSYSQLTDNNMEKIWSHNSKDKVTSKWYLADLPFKCPALISELTFQ